MGAKYWQRTSVYWGKMGKQVNRCIRYFPKAFSKGQFGNFLNMQFPMRQLPKGYVRPSEAPQAAMGVSAMRLGQTWEATAWKNVFGKIPKI